MQFSKRTASGELLRIMAYVRANLFDERENWREPLLISVAFHAMLLFGGFGLGFLMQSHSHANDWGLHEGDAVTAQLVSASIPIPKAEQSENIVANESKGVTQTQPQPKVQETE